MMIELKEKIVWKAYRGPLIYSCGDRGLGRTLLVKHDVAGTFCKGMGYVYFRI